MLRGPPAPRPTGPEHPSAGVEPGDEALRGDAAVGVGQDAGDFVPVDVDVEAHAEPAPVAHIGRPEEALGLLGDEFGLYAGRRRAPDAEDPVAVMVVDEHGDRLAIPHEPGG